MILVDTIITTVVEMVILVLLLLFCICVKEYKFPSKPGAIYYVVAKDDG